MSVSATQEPGSLADAAAPSPEAMNLRDLFYVVLRRRRLIVALTLLGAVLGALVYLVSKRMYRAESTLELLKQPSTGALKTPSEPTQPPSDSLDFNLTLQTEVNLLQSPALALQVVDELQLASVDPEFRPKSRATPSARQANWIRTFEQHLKVSPVGGTRLITVAYEDPSPEMAAKVVDRLTQDYLDYRFGVQYRTSSQANDWLRTQMQGIKSDVQRSQEAVANLQKQTGIYGVDELHNVITARLEQLNTQLVNAESTLANKEAVWRAASSGNPDAVAGLVNSGAGGGGANPTLLLLENLREQESSTRANLAALASKFGPNYPSVIETRRKLSTLEAAISAQVKEIQTRALAEYRVAKNVRDDIQGELEAQKQQAAALNSRATEYSVAKREADAKDALYQSLISRLTEAQAFAGLRASDVTVVDSARIPDKKARPSLLLDVVGGTVAAAILGLILAFVLDLLDGSLQDLGDVERLISMPLLALLPEGRTALRSEVEKITSRRGPETFYEVAAYRPDSSLGERFRALRSAVLRSPGILPTQVIAITSPCSNEGKTFVALNLAAVLAQLGRRVLVIDADTRRGKLSRFVGLDEGSGVSALLNEPSRVPHPKPWADVPGVFILPRGQQAADPVRLASSAELAAYLDQARADFDFILVNTPPVLPVVDAVEIARVADVTLVVLRFGKTTKAALEQALRMLQGRAGGSLGFVMNAMDPDGPDFVARVGKESYGYAAS